MEKSPYPCLWFDGDAHEAADHYCSIFPNSRILNKTPMVAVYELNGVRHMNMNGGPDHSFSPAISLVVSCKDQAEIDHYWQALLQDGGTEGKCGWLTDKYGVSWQISPSILGSLMSDPEKAPKVMYAFMQMKKFIIADLIKASES